MAKDLSDQLLDDVGLEWTQVEARAAVRATEMEDAHEFSDLGSPDSSSSASNHLRTLAQKTTRIINIPFRIELDILLLGLGLSKASYCLDMSEDRKVQMTIRFSASTLPKEDHPQFLTFSGIKSTSYSEAEDSACEKAIRYIERTTNTIIKDVNYERLLHAKELTEIMIEKMKDAHDYKSQLAKSWFLAVRHISSFSEQLLNIVYLNYDGQEHPDTSWNNLLRNLQNLAFNLKYVGSVFEKRVEEMRSEYFS